MKELCGSMYTYQERQVVSIGVCFLRGLLAFHAVTRAGATCMAFNVWCFRIDQQSFKI